MIETKLDRLIDTINGYIFFRPHINEMANTDAQLFTSLDSPSKLAREDSDSKGDSTSIDSQPLHDDGARKNVSSPPMCLFQALTTQFSSFDTLPPPPVLNALLDVYFTRVHNQPYSFFHEATFRRKLAQSTLPDYLIFAVLVSALRFSTDPFFQNVLHEAATGYARESWKQLVAIVRTPTFIPYLHQRRLTYMNHSGFRRRASQIYIFAKQ